MKLVYFASVREALGVGEEQLPLPQGVGTVGQPSDWLRRERGEPWCKVLGQERLLSAVNQEMCGPEKPLNDSDEVAFFPPVTGG